MKIFKLIALAATASLAMAASAQASSFSPTSTSFTATGGTNLMKGLLGPIPCTANFTGHTDSAGRAFIDTAAFTGSSLCTSVTAAGLPWEAIADSATTAKIKAVRFNSPLGPCGAEDLPVALSGGAITFNYTMTAGNCHVWTTSAIVTTPTVSIVWP